MIASQERLSFGLLGGFRLQCSWRDGIQVRQARQQRLLAYLLLNRHTSATRHQLAFAFWPDTTERQALGNLRTLLYRLRESFPELGYFLDLDSENLQWQGNVAIDVADFEQAIGHATEARMSQSAALEESKLASAIRVYAGELLPDFYDDWVTTERERLRECYLQALERLAVLEANQGRYGEAAAYIQTLLRVDGLRESGYRLLMQIRLAEGDRASALRAYHTGAGLLRRELGVDPHPETQALHQGILRLDERLQPADAQGGASVARPAPAAPFVGHRAEWRYLTERWQETLQGKAQAVLVTGEAGAGRSRLAQAFLSFAGGQGSVTASAQCVATSRELAYAPVTEWLRSGRLSERLRQAPAALSGAVMRLVDPSSRTEGGPGHEEEDAWGHRWLWEALSGGLVGRSQVPLTLLIDDAHWCDSWTLNWLAYAFRLAPSAPVLVLMTAHMDDVDGNRALANMRSSLQPDGFWSELPIGPLNLDETAELAWHITGVRPPAEAAERLHRITTGNPLFLIEMLQVDPKLADGPGPVPGDRSHEECGACPDLVRLTPRLDAVMRQRMERLSEPAKDLAQVAAVIGRPFSLELLSRAAGLPDEALLPALDELWHRQVIREHGAEQYDFSHELLRAAVYRELSPLRRKALHRAAGRAVEASSEGQMADAAAHLAHHWSLGGNSLRAAGYWLQAGDQQRLLWADVEAASYYRRAAEAFGVAREYEQAALALMKTGLASQAAFDLDAANKAYDEAFRLWRQSRLPRGPVVATANQTLRSHWTEPASLDPATGADFISSALLTQLYSGLACQGHGLEVTPAVAAGWEVQESGRRYVIRLRRDTQWNDGAPVTAHDFEAAWKRVLDPATQSGHAQLLYDIAGARDLHTGVRSDPGALGVKAADEDTLVVDLETPAPYFPQLLAHPATLPLPRHALERGGASTESLSELVTNGPFMLASWEHNVSMRLVRNPRYHGRWPGNLQEVTLRLDIPPAESLRLYDEDELDVVRLSGDHTMADLQHVQRSHASEFRSGPRLVTWQLGFDTTRPPFDDVRVRRALAMTCNRERLAQSALKGLFTPATGGFVPPGMPGHTAGVALPFDPPEGRRLLAEAGYPDGAGFPEVTLVTDNLAGDIVGFMTAEWQQRLGIAVHTVALPWAEFLHRMANERLGMYYTAWRADYPDPDSFLRGGLRWHQTQWSDPAFEEMLACARAALNGRDRLEHYTAAERLLIESAGIVPIVYGWMHLLIKPRVRRYPFSGIRPWFWFDVVIED